MPNDKEAKELSKFIISKGTLGWITTRGRSCAVFYFDKDIGCMNDLAQAILSQLKE